VVTPLVELSPEPTIMSATVAGLPSGPVRRSVTPR
jgi:hypothetical protein